jgi:acetyl-CoA carboxylase carboxyl transferase subunit alpha
MLQYAYYSVISPEGCAGILWKSHEYAERAAGALKFTSKHLLGFGVVDDVIEEPLGGAHRDHHHTAASIRNYLKKNLKDLTGQPTEKLLQRRYEKFRRMGQFLEPTEASV